MSNRSDPTSRLNYPNDVAMVPASDLLPNLLNATKLGRQRNQLLKWLRHPRSPTEKLLRPTALTNHYGAKTGLTNQLFALVGCCVLANLTGATLVLPPFTDTRGSVPFDRLFDPAHFAYAARGTVRVLQHSSHGTAKDATVLRLESDRGWLLYKGMTQAFRWPDERLRVLQRVERSVYAALRPSPPVNRLASGIARRLLRMEGEAKEAAPPPYGCMHTRLERDMRQIVRVNHAGALPSLRDYLSPGLERHFPALRAVSRVFVSVGTDIPAPDWRRLQGRTSWNATLHTSKRTFGPGEGQLSPLVAALADAQVCRNATWLLGWPGSTFSRMLGLFRELDHGHGYYTICPQSTACYIRPRSIGRHSFCTDIFFAGGGLDASRAIMPSNATSPSEATGLYMREIDARCVRNECERRQEAHAELGRIPTYPCDS